MGRNDKKNPYSGMGIADLYAAYYNIQGFYKPPQVDQRQQRIDACIAKLQAYIGQRRNEAPVVDGEIQLDTANSRLAYWADLVGKVKVHGAENLIKMLQGDYSIIFPDNQLQALTLDRLGDITKEFHDILPQEYLVQEQNRSWWSLARLHR